MNAAMPPVLEEAAAKSSVPIVVPEEQLRLSASRLRRWGIQSSLAIVDQGLTAAAGLGVNLVLARWLSPEIYGAFAVAFAGYLFVSGFHNVLLLEPLSVLGPARHVNWLPAYFRAQIAVHVLLVGIFAMAVIAAGLAFGRFQPSNPLAGALVGGGLALPLMLLLWLVRRMCYVLQRPTAAVLGSSVYLAFVAVSLFAAWRMGKVSPLVVFLLMGGGSLLSSVVVLQRLGLGTLGSVQEVRWNNVLDENWRYGRWLLGSAVLYAATSQLQTVLAAALLGLGAAGVLRAMQIPSLVMTQMTTATGLLVLPVFAYDFGRGQTKRLERRATLVSMMLPAGALAFVLILAAFGHSIEHILFGGKYAAFAWLMSVLALVPVLTGFTTGYSVALRASQKPQFDLISNLVAAPVSLLSALLLIRWWGLAGAAASMVLGFTALGLTTYVCFRFHLSRKQTAEVVLSA